MGHGYDTGMDESRDLVPYDSYDKIQDALRPELATKLTRLMKALEPYVDGTFGDIDPRHAAVMVQLIKETGRLYRVFDRPQQIVEGFTEEQVQARIAEAVAVAVEVARAEWEHQRHQKALEDRERVRGILGS